MLIKYENLDIRNAVKSDAKQLTEWWNDGKVMAHAGFPNGLGTTEEEVTRQITDFPKSKGERMIIEADGVSIGEMNYRNVGSKTAEIGIKICDFSKQEKGYGKKLLSMFIKELFSMGFDKIILDTNLNNKRAQHVYEELGFRKLRVNIDAWKDQLGRKQSSVDYEMNKGQLNDFTR